MEGEKLFFLCPDRHMVNDDGCQDHKTFDRSLPEGRNVQQVQCVVQHADDESTDDYTADGAYTALAHAASAYDRCRNSIHFITGACIWLCRIQACSNNESTNRCQDAADCVDHNLGLVDLDTTQAGCLLIAAQGIYMAAKPCLIQDKQHNNRDDCQYDDRERNSKHITCPEEGNTILHADRHTAGCEHGEAAEH